MTIAGLIERDVDVSYFLTIVYFLCTVVAAFKLLRLWRACAVRVRRPARAPHPRRTGRRPPQAQTKRGGT
jgi:hypothetical protein